MKKDTLVHFKRILFSALLVFIVGCHSNKERLSEDGKKWKLVLSEYNGTIEKEEAYLDFDEDGDFTITNDSKISRGQYQTKGSDSIKMKPNDDEGIFEATYHFVENKLKLEGIVDSQDTVYWVLEEYVPENNF